MSKVVLDASAVLAYARGERGSDVVGPRMSNSAISAVNYSEVLKKTIEHGGDANVTAALLERSRVDVIPFSRRQAAETAELFPTTKVYGLSFADRACLALAIELKLPLYTADQRLADVDAPVKIVLIREAAVTGGKRRK